MNHIPLLSCFLFCYKQAQLELLKKKFFKSFWSRIDLVHTCSSVCLVSLIWTKKKEVDLVRLAFTLAFFHTEPEDTESKGIGICSQPDWSTL